MNSKIYIQKKLFYKINTNERKLRIKCILNRK